MTIVNHECYVSLEVATLLKEAGFDWECALAYLPTTERGDTPFEHFSKPTNYNGHYPKTHEVYSAPTLQVAQRWLREVKGYYVAWEFNMNISSWGSELYDFANISVYIFVDSKQGNICKCRLKENYKIVEEAQEAGIKKALELILEKGK